VNCGLKLYQANLVLEDTVERIYHGNAFAENWHGLFLIRGENVVLLGEIVRYSFSSEHWLSDHHVGSRSGR
jgi:Small nuclear ribonucleoprotein (snRNP) homolog